MPPRNASRKQPASKAATTSRAATASYISDDDDDIKVIEKSDGKNAGSNQKGLIAKLQSITGNLQ
jgi:hypothetical protein